MFRNEQELTARALLAAIVNGRPIRGDRRRLAVRCAHVAADEGGLVVWATLVAVLFLLTLAALVGNVTLAINQKIETQNAADAATYTGSLWMARGMNAVTASNHLMGELMSLYVLHHSVGGAVLDRGDTKSTPFIPWVGVFGTYWYARFNATTPVVDKDNVEDDPRGEATVFDAKIQLKWIMMGAYSAHALGGKLAKFPLTAAWGMAMQAGAYLTELKVDQEYQFLTGVESIALSLRPAKRAVPGVMRALYAYEQGIALEVPVAARQGASMVGERNNTVAEIVHENLFTLRLLPVDKETTRSESRSQLIRATYPWVNYWRAPILDFLFWGATLSGAKGYYLTHSNNYSHNLCQCFRADAPDRNGYGGYGFRLFVVRDLEVLPPARDKSMERWAYLSGTPRADHLFCLMGFARQHEAPSVWAAPLFRQANPDGIMCFAQGMVYNANPQQSPAPSRGGGSAQPRVGWDTLNWTANAIEFSTRDDDPPRPQIKLNWQAKLVPVSQLRLAAMQFVPIGDNRMNEMFRERLRPNNPLGKSLYTH